MACSHWGRWLAPVPMYVPGSGLVSQMSLAQACSLCVCSLVPAPAEVADWGLLWRRLLPLVRSGPLEVAGLSIVLWRTASKFAPLYLLWKSFFPFFFNFLLILWSTVSLIHLLFPLDSLGYCVFWFWLFWWVIPRQGWRYVVKMDILLYFQILGKRCWWFTSGMMSAVGFFMASLCHQPIVNLFRVFFFFIKTWILRKASLHLLRWL